ncbi:hypothetical protein NYV52_01520 [Escherichia coli]|nr:hypothetical protein [Escherichia coli]
MMTLLQQGWPQLMQDVRPRQSTRHPVSGEDRQPAAAPRDPALRVPLNGTPPATLTPLIFSVDKQSQRLDLLLLQSADEYMQGVVRLNGTLYPALATPTADSRQLVINAMTDRGLQFAGYGEAINRDADGPKRPAPQLMQFHLKQQDSPLFAAIHKPEEQPDKLFRSLGLSRPGKNGLTAKRRRTGRKNSATGTHSPGR